MDPDPDGPVSRQAVLKGAALGTVAGGVPSQHPAAAADPFPGKKPAGGRYVIRFSTADLMASAGTTSGPRTESFG